MFENPTKDAVFILRKLNQHCAQGKLSMIENSSDKCVSTSTYEFALLYKLITSATIVSNYHADNLPIDSVTTKSTNYLSLCSNI